MAATEAGNEEETGQDERAAAQRFRRMSAAFGFGQGLCNNIFLSSDGYWGERLNNDQYFFVWMCASVYIAPFILFALASWLDLYFDSKLGLRTVFQVRMASSLMVNAVLVAALSALTGDLGGASAIGPQKVGILVLGSLIGMLSGSVASASLQFFGAIGSQHVPLFFLGQTASGAYVNVAARLLNFHPGTQQSYAVAYFAGGVAVAVLPAVIFIIWQWTGRLEVAYQQHVEPPPSVPLGNFVRSLTWGQRNSAGSIGSAATEPLEESEDTSWKVLRRAAVSLQILTVTLNISLTPLANVIARGNFRLGQEIVLLKLLSDFLGRMLFFAIPEPRRLGLHMTLNWTMTVLRIPIWALVLQHSLGQEPLLGDTLLLVLWVPFVTTGALGGSWAQVVAIKAVPESQRRATASLLNIAVYIGYLLGVLFAACTVLERSQSD